VEKTSGVESSRKILRALLAFSERKPQLSIADLIQELDVPSSTAYRYVSLLREVGLLERAGGSRYQVSPRVFALAGAAQAVNDLGAVALPVMHRLVSRVDEKVQLMRATEGFAVCIDRVECTRAVRLHFQPGQTVPLGTGASGKVLLSLRPPAERNAYLERQAAAGAPWADRLPALKRELDQIAQQGWAQSCSEIDDDVWACSAAIPGTSPPAAVTVAAPSYRVDEERRRLILGLLLEGCREIAAKAGGAGGPKRRVRRAR
jgi:DNA-binding IclR family transcriptional regulator